MSNNIIFVVVVFAIFVLGYLAGGEDTKECVAFGGQSQGKYALAPLATVADDVWILDTEEGRLWRGSVNINRQNATIFYLGRVQVGQTVISNILKR
ncbi:MAG: hypothetical protein ACYSRP_03175 [Planctomycetota bacterium]|jgi:hypothetical protein